MKVYKKAILPLGFRANGVSCGIKRSGRPDLALFYSKPLAKAACLFTTNKIQAAPIHLNKEHLRINSNFHGLIVNSGNANAFTGKSGLKDARDSVKALAKELGVREKEILVASTGIIGKRLPVAKIRKSAAQLIKGLSCIGIRKAARAIMTTDTFTKEITVKFNLGKKIITLCGVAKGAGMIAPDMALCGHGRSATMLAFIFTDANITARALDRALVACADKSFHCITIDGCMSTNDSIMLLANGACMNTLISKSKDLKRFSLALGVVCRELAKMIILDAEGATKFIRIKINGAKDFNQAKKAALSIANSSLFKTAVYGQNPNFGRIVSALGSSGIEVEERLIRIKVSPLRKKEITVEVALNKGSASATVYTSDLTPEYVRINAGYN
jgi:glutamate N-acetyltransferase/amino-acid N-acetyltransferase